MTKLLIVLAAGLVGLFLIEKVFPGIKYAVRQANTRTRLSMLPASEYITIDQLRFDSAGSLKIDYAVVSRYGVFMITEKPFGGRIFGKVEDVRWVRVVLGREYPFKNPLPRIGQSRKALSAILDIPLEAVIPITVFSGGASIWVKASAILIPGHRLRSAILSFKKPLLSYDQVQQISLQLSDSEFK